MEIARLFATAGFKIDMSGVAEFKAVLSSLKTDITDTAIAVGKLKNNITGLTAQVKAFQKTTSESSLTNWRKGIIATMQDMYRLQQQQATNTFNANHFAEQFIRNLTRLHSAIAGRDREIYVYAAAIDHLASSFQQLKAATTGIQRFRQVPSQATYTSRAQGGAGTGGMGRPRGGGGYEDNQYIGYWGRASGVAKTPLAAFLRPMLPTGMGLFNAVAAGYGVKELVSTGREMMAMDTLLKTVSGDAANYQKNLAFVKKTSDELGMSQLDLANSYAKIYYAAKDAFPIDQIQESYKGAQAYFRLLGLSPEKVKLANKAIEQMFNKQAVQAEELKNQLGDQAAGVMQFFSDAAGVGIVQLQKMMKEGKVGTDVVIKAGAAMGKFAYSSKDFQVQLQRSGSAQERFNNRMREMAQMLMESGLDEFLTNIFQILSSLLVILNPFVKLIADVLHKLSNFAKLLIQNKDELMSFGKVVGTVTLAVGGLTLAAGLASSGLLRVAVQILAIGTASKVLTFVTNRVTLLTAAVGGLVSVWSDVFDYWNGEDNWVHGLSLDLEIAALNIQIFFMKITESWQAWKDSVGVNPMGAIGRLFSFSNPKFQTLESGISNTAEIVSQVFDKLMKVGPLPTPSPISGPQSSPQQVTTNITLHVGSIPPSIANSPKETANYLGDFMGSQLRIGQVGVWGSN